MRMSRMSRRRRMRMRRMRRVQNDRGLERKTLLRCSEFPFNKIILHQL